MWRPKLGIPLAAIGLGVLWMSIGTSGQSTPVLRPRKNGEWPHYTADLRGTKYSPLDQINASNFKDLEVAWRFKTDSLGTRPEYKLEGTPLMVGGVLYTTGGTRRSVVALDARTGELLWVHRYPGRHARRERAAAALRTRRRLLDRRPRRRSRAVCHARLPADRAQREDRRADSVLRQERRRGHEGRRGVRQRPADRSRDRRDRTALDAHRRQGRRHRRIVDEGRHDDHDAQQHQGSRACLRRTHRQGAVDVQHDSSAGRVRQRHVAERLVGRQRQHRRVDADHGGRGARPRLSAGRVAVVRLLRRQAARQQPVRREPGCGRSEDRSAQVALPARSSSDLGSRHLVGADPARRDDRRPRCGSSSRSRRSSRSSTSSIA